nr:hypothetical protein [Tanacetum cinerariifolium]
CQIHDRSNNNRNRCNNSMVGYTNDGMSSPFEHVILHNFLWRSPSPKVTFPERSCTPNSSIELEITNG